MSEFLLVTDLDNTLIGDEEALQCLNDWFKQHRQTYGSYLVYATGRSLKSYQRLITQTSLLEPDVLIASVGTEIYYLGNELDETWSSLVAHGWNREVVSVIAQQFPQLIPQPNSEQRPFKLSFVLNEEDSSILPRIEAQFMTQGIEAELIYSNDRDLDIVRRKANKGNALIHIREVLGLAAEQTIVCGDSGNDIALFAANKAGIIVGNARRELLQWHQDNLENKRYLAQAQYAAGIIEGLKHFSIIYE
jgi:sucrose-6-phosphatase